MTTVQDSRARVLQAVREASAPLAVEDLVEATGLHANTIRGHLEVLIALGDVERTAGASSGRGRPPWLYRPAGSNPSPYRALAEALVAQLDDVGEPAVVQRAAERWATGLPEARAASSPDDAVAMAVDALQRLGFDAESVGLGDAITLTHCPYADLASGNTSICEIHAALLVQLFEHSGQDVSMTQLDVNPRPGVCVARLARPDLAPQKSIRIEDPESRKSPSGASA